VAELVDPDHAEVTRAVTDVVTRDGDTRGVSRRHTNLDAVLDKEWENKS
jgi:hypothetical protein